MTAVIYRFGPFRLDVAARELRRDDALLPLPASAFDCLAYLVAERDRAVGRDELIAAVWGRADVSDTMLGQTVLKVRRTLGGRGDPQAWIRTVPRFGYRWVAPVEPIAEAPMPASVGNPVPTQAPVASPAALPDAGTPTEPGKRRVKAVIGLAAALVVLAIVFGLWRSPAADRAGPAVANDSALILPVRIDSYGEHGWLRLGLMDLLAERLRQAGLSVPPSESVLAVLRERTRDDGTVEPLGDLANWQVQTVARLDDGEWIVEIEADATGLRHHAQARAVDPVQAARGAGDALLARLGRLPPDPVANSIPALDEVLQRTRAAMLADQFELARSQIEHAPAELQRRPELLHRRAQIELRAGDYLLVESLLRELLADLQPGENDDLRARAWITLAASHVRRQDAAAAAQAYDQALSLLEPAPNPDRSALGLAYLGRGLVAAMHGRLDAATEDLGRARIQMQAGGDALGLAQVDLNLGVFDVLRQRPADGRGSLLRAAERFERLGAREELVYTLNAIAEIDSSLLQHTLALQFSDRIWPPQMHSGNARSRWDLVLTRARILFDLGRLDEADELLDGLLGQADPSLDRFRLARAWGLQARIATDRGASRAAGDAAARALVIIAEQTRPTDSRQELRTWLLRLLALQAQGEHERAGRELSQMHAWSERYGGVWAQVYLPLADAVQARASGASDRSLALFEQALSQAEALAVPDVLVEVVQHQVLALIEQAQLDRAQAVAGRVATWAEADARAAWTQAAVLHALGYAQASEQAAATGRRLAGQRLPIQLAPIRIAGSP